MSTDGRRRQEAPRPVQAPWREGLYRVIFEADTPAGRSFDILLIVSILLSVAVVLLDSVQAVRVRHRDLLVLLEWFFTLLFTVEYVLRIICSVRPGRYTLSFFGIVDLLSILPTYVSFFFPTSRYFTVIRILRILRVFRVMKLVQYVGEADVLMGALWEARRKIVVFLFTVLCLVTVFGSIMYVVEGEQNGFTSIPRSIYWAVVTLTTVGYGDISPQTSVGQVIAAVVMVLGFAIIAIPTGIVTAEMVRQGERKKAGRTCRNCNTAGHGDEASFCRFCGGALGGS
jgi:voltage-gated potassium channel